jgi:hypothetical protein
VYSEVEQVSVQTPDPSSLLLTQEVVLPDGETHAVPAVGQPAGVGSGVGSGIGSGVGAGVGSGVGTGVGTTGQSITLVKLLPGVVLIIHSPSSSTAPVYSE